MLVNGVPASGKSGVAQALSDRTGWPILSLDTVKNPFLTEFAPVDRPTNRRFGAAAERSSKRIVDAGTDGRAAAAQRDRGAGWAAGGADRVGF